MIDGPVFPEAVEILRLEFVIAQPERHARPEKRFTADHPHAHPVERLDDERVATRGLALFDIGRGIAHREEDDRDVPGLGAALDVGSGLEPVDSRHSYIKNNCGEVDRKKISERLESGRRLNKVGINIFERRFKSDQIRRRVVDE